MPRYLALLRGINVGGRNKVPMADLRAVAAGLGHRDVRTYIQSGNLIFTSDAADPAGLAGALAGQVETELGVRAPVVVIAAPELARVIAANPFPAAASPKLLHAVFSQHEPGPDRVAAVAAEVERVRARGSRDDAVLAGRTLYLHTPDGFGDSELAARLARLGPDGTARNWVTVTRLRDMMGA